MASSESDGYLMEHDNESRRLVMKTRKTRVLDQASWAGLKSGMRVLDLGCGAGVTTSFFAETVRPGGSAMGLDGSSERISYAREQYPEAEFQCRDIYSDLTDLGTFDFIWLRFFLEYHARGYVEILKNAVELLNPGGILCAADLDHNCLNHYPIDPDLEAALYGLTIHLNRNLEWDPFIGRKLYTALYDLGLTEIDVRIDAHHCICGVMNDVDEMNWLSKLKIAAQNSAYAFPNYQEGLKNSFTVQNSCLMIPAALPIPR